MCGIVLTWGIPEKKLLNSINKIYHRGPYNTGVTHIDNVGLGMVQLPMKKHQVDMLPVKYKSYYVVYNGEIYDEDATDLSKEVAIAINNILHLKPLNGMFALAAYNEEEKKIIIARDEFGIKPIYFFLNKQNKIFIACSEILPILELIGSTSVNKSTIAEIVLLGTQAGEATCFSDIHLLEPGNILTFDLKEMKVEREVLPSLMPEINNLDELIEKSVSACADTFRPGSLLLSDGMDSNLLLTYLRQDINKYNIITDQDSLGVTPNIYSNLKQTKLNKENFWIQLEKAIFSYAQPCRMSSILMYQSLSDFIKTFGSHMVITGEGADEFFWGYPRYNKISEHLINNSNLREFFFTDFEENINLLEPSIDKNNIIHCLDEFLSSSENLLDSIYRLEKKFSLEPLLRRTDHILMKNTIEARVPFLHFGIPNFAKSLGFEKLKNEHNKYPLVNIMKKRNVNYLIKSKQHFRAPLQEWFAEKKLSDYFNSNRLEILSSLGVSVDSLRNCFQKMAGHQIFIFFTMVVWYEKFSSYL